jgi:hypothetical protein
MPQPVRICNAPNRSGYLPRSLRTPTKPGAPLLRASAKGWGIAPRATPWCVVTQVHFINRLVILSGVGAHLAQTQSKSLS